MNEGSYGDASGPKKQRGWWDRCYRDEPLLFGRSSSECARVVAGEYRRGARLILELGAGYGRDMLNLADHGFECPALNSSGVAVRLLEAHAEVRSLEDRVRALRHDARRPLSCSDGVFDGVFARMHLCTECSIGQFRVLVAGTLRILCPGGALVSSVRHGGDTHAPEGAGCLDGCREHGGFVVGVRARNDRGVRRGGSPPPSLVRGHARAGRGEGIRDRVGCRRRPEPVLVVEEQDRDAPCLYRPADVAAALAEAFAPAVISAVVDYLLESGRLVLDDEGCVIAHPHGHPDAARFHHR